MGSDEMLRYEESHYDDLVERFIEKNKTLWEDYVADMYREYYAGSIDHAKDTGGKNGK